MKNRIEDIKRILTPSDSLPIVIVVIGILIAVFLPDVAMKVIGGSVAVLALLALIIILSQRVQTLVDLRPRNQQPTQQTQFSTSVKKDTASKRVIFDDYANSFGADSEIEKKEVNEEELTSQDDNIVPKENENANIFDKDAIPSSVRIIEKKEKQEEQSQSEIAEQKEIFENEIAEPVSKDIQEIKPEKTAKEKKKINIQLADFISDFPSAGLEPRKEFDYLLSRVLMVIRSVMSARTACYFWVNSEKRELVLESYLTDMTQFIKDKTKFNISSDVISQIAINGKPEILTEINPSAESDLIPYYSSNASTSSFIGVPVFYNNSVIGVLSADTELYDAYDEITVGFLGQFTKLIGGLVHSYIEKYDLAQSSKVLTSIETFRNLAKESELTNGNIAEDVIEAACEVSEYTTIGVCCYDEEQGFWSVQALKSKDEKAKEMLGKKVHLRSSLLGAAIAKSETIVVSPNDLDNIRVMPEESKIEGGYFAALPFKGYNDVYGALFIEGANYTSVTQADIDALEALSEHAGMAFERLSLMRYLKEGAMYDYGTGSLNQRAFVDRLNEEIARANDYKTNFSLSLLKIDKYATIDSYSDENTQQVIQYKIFEKIKSLSPQYFIVGKISGDLLCILTVGLKAQQAQLWSERLRNEIAISPIKLGHHQINFTISVGIAEYIFNETAEKLYEKAEKALQIASQKSNAVHIFA